MDKHRFLRSEYERIMVSGDYVWSGWRDSYEGFQADLWDMTPTGNSGRYLAPRDKELGFSPDNIEWHFRKVRSAKRTKAQRKPTKRPGRKGEKAVPQPVTATERRRLAEMAKEERRRQLAEEFRRGEEMRLSRDHCRQS